MDKSPATRASAAPPTEPRLFGDAERGDTRAKILDAAFRRLATEGYAALSVREIARDAGVNHALINYHFRTKDQLVIAVLDAANQRLLARQAAMYQAPGGFAQKWARGAPLLRERPRARASCACRPSCGRPACPTPNCATSSCRACWRGSSSCSARCARRWRPSRPAAWTLPRAVHAPK